ncbi:MAG: hypothetical protein EBR51_10325, partial [Gammaproteobacteria bacterium]|nr:hypothetical protein [Gammaproteobacteria bacterium]
RTITEMDNILFCALTHNPQPLHLDEEFSKKHSLYKTRVAPGLMTASIGAGMLEDILGKYTLAALGLDRFKFTAPVTSRPVAVSPPFAASAPVKLPVPDTARLPSNVEFSLTVNDFVVMPPGKVIGSVMPANKAEGLTCDSVPSTFATTIRSLAPSVVLAAPPTDITPTRPSS